MNLLIFLHLTYKPCKNFNFFLIFTYNQGKVVLIVPIFTYNQGKVSLILPITWGGTCIPGLHWELPPPPDLSPSSIIIDNEHYVVLTNLAGQTFQG